MTIRTNDALPEGAARNIAPIRRLRKRKGKPNNLLLPRNLLLRATIRTIDALPESAAERTDISEKTDAQASVFLYGKIPSLCRVSSVDMKKKN